MINGVLCIHHVFTLFCNALHRIWQEFLSKKPGKTRVCFSIIIFSLAQSISDSLPIVDDPNSSLYIPNPKAARVDGAAHLIKKSIKDNSVVTFRSGVRPTTCWIPNYRANDHRMSYKQERNLMIIVYIKVMSNSVISKWESYGVISKYANTLTHMNVCPVLEPAVPTCNRSVQMLAYLVTFGK